VTQAEAVSFFEGYADSFAAFDAEAIADWFHLPSMILDGNGVANFAKRADLVWNFEAVNDGHRSLGFGAAVLEACEISSRYSDKLVQAKTRWRFNRADGSEIYRFPVDYILCKYGAEWKIAVTLNPDG
jgi:hypothetical protein